MNEKQLRELIRIVVGTGTMLGFLGMLTRGKNASPEEDAPTGIERFLASVGIGKKRDSTTNDPATGKSEYGTRRRAEVRVDEIIRSVMASRSPEADPSGGQDSSDSLQATISGAIERQERVDAGQVPPITQPSAPRTPKQEQSEKDAKEPSRSSNAMDMLQLGLDAVGVVDPTPISDGINAAISVGRAFVTDPGRRNEHLKNAAISTVSMVPYVGDFAKTLKVPRAAKTLQRTAKTLRGADRAAEGGKAMSAVEKRAARERYRNAAQQATDFVGNDAPKSDMEETAVRQSAGGGNGTRTPPSQIGSPDPDDGRSRSISDAREESEGIAEHDAWGEKLKSAGNKLAGFAGILGEGAKKAAAFVGGLHLLNTGVLALNRELAQYNGTLASSYAKSDAADIQRDMRRGQVLSGSLSGLNQQQSALKDNINEALMPIQNVAIRLLTEITRLTNDALDFMGVIIEIVPGAKQALETLTKVERDDGTAWNQFFQDVSDGKFDGQRPTFLNPKSQILNDADHQEVFGP